MGSLIAKLATVLVMLAALYTFVGRKADFLGLIRATAQKTVNRIDDEVPFEIHVEKAKKDIDALKSDAVNRGAAQIQLDAQLKADQQQLTVQAAEIERQKRFLSEAYLARKAAAEAGLDHVRFADRDYELVDFTREIEERMTRLDHLAQKHEMQRQTLERLQAGRVGGGDTVDSIRMTVMGLQQNLETLVLRKQLADDERRVLELQAIAAQSGDAGSSLGRTLQHLNDDAEKAEALNEAGRLLLVEGGNTAHDPLERQWSQMERLKEIHDTVNTQPTTPTTPPVPKSTVPQGRPVKKQK